MGRERSTGLDVMAAAASNSYRDEDPMHGPAPGLTGWFCLLLAVSTAED